MAGPAAGQPHIAGIASVPNSGSASGNIMGVYTPNGMEINHAADYGAASAAAGYQQFYPYSYAPHQTAMYPADMYQVGVYSVFYCANCLMFCIFRIAIKRTQINKTKRVWYYQIALLEGK